MAEASDFELLQDYTGRKSEEAFGALVKRHLNLVYSVALSRVRDEAAAKDIAQIVFTVLAEKAGRLSEKVVLSGWLFQVTAHACQDFKRSEARRKKWESEAMQQDAREKGPEGFELRDVARLISSALGDLGTAERDAILLRFFDGHDFRQVGERLGVSEAAAKMRVSRGLEKLRRLLEKRGVTVSEAALSGALPLIMQPAPAGVAAAIQAGAMAQAGMSASNAAVLKGVLKTMAWTKVKTGVVSAILAAAVITPFVVRHEAQARVREQDLTARGQAEQLAAAKAENERLANLAANSELSKEQARDLATLRRETASLQKQTADVPQLQAENRRLKAALNKPRTPLQIAEDGRTKAGYGKNWVIAFYKYAEKHGDEFPTNFDMASAFRARMSGQETNVSPDQFEIVYQGKLGAITNRSQVIVLREREAWQTPANGNRPAKWAKVYSFADGHSEIHSELENNFDDYEQKHIIPAEGQ